MNLLLIGCGNIGGALLKVWVPLALFKHIVVVDPNPLSTYDFEGNASIKIVYSVNGISDNFIPDLIVLAIKPQQLNEVMPEIIPYLKGSLTVSLLAGISLGKLLSFTTSDSKIIRIMPNIAIKTGKSTNLAFADSGLNSTDIHTVEKFFSPSGKIIWLKEEKYLDVLTPISGSGAAYFFLLAETLIMETIKLGIEEDMARELIQQVFLGSSSLIVENTNFVSLISTVASKGGITEAALQVIAPAMRQAVAEAFQVALVRLKELSNENCS